ncbi:AAA family ATPase [Rhizobium sp.]|uniref:ATP-dependent nuclease n=1 Tax=Rhizobium sp. TaxID=391 RepID=UPI0028B18AF2
MILPFSLQLERYRSIQSNCFIPFNHRTTFIVGPNNSGKSNILRALAAIFNQRYTAGDLKSSYTFQIKNKHLLEFSGRYRHLSSRLRDFNQTVSLQLINGRLKINDVPVAIRDYASQREFLNDFSVGGSTEANIGRLYQSFQVDLIEPQLTGSIYVPNVRYITVPSVEPQVFSKQQISGDVLNYGTIVNELAALNHPSTDNRQKNREKFSRIQDFLAYCLDKKNVRIEVPFDQSTIHVDIDGIEHALHDLGTGIEQLLIIGLASFGFSGKMTLIDEPEIHFHPTAQKRMVQYLNDNVTDANFVFATHSAAILDAVEADILQVAYDQGQSFVKTVSSNTQRYLAVRDLGHSPSDLLLTRFAIWVEGPSDRIYVNHWISKIDETLIEGVDYTVLFYGGKILSHHSFLDEESELVQAVSLARAFAVIMDSDRKPGRSKINKTKSRVRDEIEKQGGICWITEGREVENYLPNNVIRQLATTFPGATEYETKLDQVLDPDRVKKNDFARAAIKIDSDDWPFDLKARITELVDAIHAAR